MSHRPTQHAAQADGTRCAGGWNTLLRTKFRARIAYSEAGTKSMENIANFGTLAIKDIHHAPSIFTPKTPRKRAKFAHLDSHLKQAVDVQVFRNQDTPSSSTGTAPWIRGGAAIGPRRLPAIAQEELAEAGLVGKMQPGGNLRYALVRRAQEPSVSKKHISQPSTTARSKPITCVRNSESRYIYLNT